MIMKLFAFITLLLTSQLLVNAQSINPELAKKYTMEVYKGTDYATVSHVEANKDLLKRVHIKKMDPSNDAVKGYIVLSKVDMFDKYNVLSRDKASNFKPSTFNPLKYNFNFYDKNNLPVIYRVDFTNYFIIIQPR